MATILAAAFLSEHEAKDKCIDPFFQTVLCRLCLVNISNLIIKQKPSITLGDATRRAY